MKSLLTGLALAALTCGAVSGAAELAVATAAAEKAFPAFGSKAPEFKPATWVRGEAPKNLGDDKVHLLFFWSTLSSGAVKAIPVVNDLRIRFDGKGVDITGVSVWEESESVVRDFIRTRGDALTFPVAFDGRDAGGTVSKRWLEDTGINGIPYVFAIKSGRVLWHGTPDELEADAVGAMIAGTYDIPKAEARIAADQAAREKAEPVFSLIEDLRMDRKFDEALAKCDELEKMLPAHDRTTANLTRAQTYFEKGEFDKGYTQVAIYVDSHRNDPDVLAMTALSLVAEPAFEGHRNFPLAKRFADRALEIAPIDAYKLLTARVAYTAGDRENTDKILAALAATKDLSVHAQIKLIKVAIAASQPWPIAHKSDCSCGAH